MLMLWAKAFHIFFVVSWFAGLFYLPRIFVNLAMIQDNGAEKDRLLLMARKLYRFVTPIGILAASTGTSLKKRNQTWECRFPPATNSLSNQPQYR